MNAEGELSLQSNYFTYVEISAVDSCGLGVNASRSIHANLKPETYDVDLGAITGAPFGTVTMGETFSVDIRIQGSANFDITAFQVIVTFDAAVVQVASDSDCALGSDWISSFECTTNDPVDEVLIIG